MSEPADVLLPASVLAAIHAEGSRGYPYEACGALLGPAPWDVKETIALPNRETGAPRVRFTVSPEDYLAVEAAADARGLQLLGFWHSHPDHPARPSATDRQYAWEGLLTLVLAVEKGEPRALTAWVIASHDAPFHELALVTPKP